MKQWNVCVVAVIFIHQQHFVLDKFCSNTQNCCYLALDSLPKQHIFATFYFQNNVIIVACNDVNKYRPTSIVFTIIRSDERCMLHAVSQSYICDSKMILYIRTYMLLGHFNWPHLTFWIIYRTDVSYTEPMYHLFNFYCIEVMCLIEYQWRI